MHSHKCGLLVLGFSKELGCGYIWTHPDREEYKLADHYCPRCGRGPFLYQMPEKWNKDYDLQK